MKNMRVPFFLIYALLSLTCFRTWAQDTTSVSLSDKNVSIGLAAVLSDNIDMPNAATRNYLGEKIRHIITANDLGNAGYDQRFIMLADLHVLSNTVAASTPPMYTCALELSLFVGDGIEGHLFSSTSSVLKGTGATQTAAYMSALKQIRPENPVYATLIRDAKDKIVRYYEARCDVIMKEAESLAQQDQYEAALASLMQVPSTSSCYTKSMKVGREIYQRYVDRRGAIALHEATQIWNTSQNLVAANQVASLLSKVDPAASCYKDACSLSEKVAQRVLQLDAREWNYTLDRQAMEKDRINAMTEIGVAFGKNQPKQVVYHYDSWMRR